MWILSAFADKSFSNKLWIHTCNQSLNHLASPYANVPQSITNLVSFS